MIEPIVSVIIPAYGRRELLEKAIRTTILQDITPSSFEIIVVDSSPDEENIRRVEQLSESSSRSIRCYAKRPEGPGPSRNFGATKARGEFLAFMDSDCFPEASWLRESLSLFGEGVGIVQGKTIPDPNAELGVLTDYPLIESENFIYECTNIIYRREAFEATDGFAADRHPRSLKPLGGEDVTLAWSVKRAGWTVRFAENSIVYHAVARISFWRWVFVKRIYLWPGLVKRFPEIRDYMVIRMFWDMAQAWLSLALVGVALSAWSPWTLLAGIPYAVYRGSARSRSFPGLLRPLRVLPYFVRDLTCFTLLLTGSIRSRSLLL